MLNYLNNIAHEYMNACPCVKKTQLKDSFLLYRLQNLFPGVLNSKENFKRTL